MPSFRLQHLSFLFVLTSLASLLIVLIFKDDLALTVPEVKTVTYQGETPLRIHYKYSYNDHFSTEKESHFYKRKQLKRAISLGKRKDLKLSHTASLIGKLVDRERHAGVCMRR